MEGLSAGAITLLQYLLPGFVAAWIFYGFTAHPKPSQFERVVQALIFTFIVQIVSEIARAGLSGSDLDLVVPTPVADLMAACLLGIAAAYSVNSDKLHSAARRLGLTHRNSYVSEWFSAFAGKATYVVLHLKDDRRIYGWPREWPSRPTDGHIRLEQVSWLLDDQEVKLESVRSILIDVRDIRWVEFIEPEREP